MACSEIRVQGSYSANFRALLHRFRKPAGFAYIALLAIIVIIGISLAAAGKYWQNVMLRDKEAELLFRGDQYRRAIEHYYLAVPANPQYPPEVDDLIEDSRSVAGRRFLRQKFKDPITGEDFVYIRDGLTNGITGVRSASDKTPLKQANFPKSYQDFTGKDKYSDWLFVSTATVTIPRGQAYPGMNPRARRLQQ
jgi:type II secretory pathway pseudopilin PulG